MTPALFLQAKIFARAEVLLSRYPNRFGAAYFTMEACILVKMAQNGGGPHHKTNFSGSSYATDSPLRASRVKREGRGEEGNVPPA